MYLLEMRVQAPSKQALLRIAQQQKKVAKSLEKSEAKSKTNLSESESIHSTNSVQSSNDTGQQQISLFDHFKNVFLDPKSYDPYVVNYTVTDHNEENSAANETSMGAFILSSLIGESAPTAPG